MEPQRMVAKERISLAVNSMLHDAMVARQRASLLYGGQGIDDKRKGSAWCEYGFPEVITNAMLYSLYKRGGLAHGAVNKVIGACWKTNPWVIEGDADAESRTETAWERSTKAELTPRLWRQFAEADRRRLVSRYSGLVLHINDGRPWNQPVLKGKRIVKATPAWADALTPSQFDTNENSPTYGQVTEWQYREERQDGAVGRRVKVHPDRVFILGDWAKDAIGWLEPAYNAFVSIEKIEGGSGESFLKNAARQMAVNFDKEIDFKSLASAYGLEGEDIHSVLNEAARDVNSANDLLMILQGATVTPLVSTVPDPRPPYDVNLQTISAALDIPSRILVGNQQGERASTEDQKYFNARCQSRRLDLSFEIEDFVDHLIRIGVLKPVGEKTIMWDDLNEQTDGEKLDSALKMTQINSTAVATGEAVFDPNEIRTVAGYDPNGGIPLGEDDEDEDGDETTPTYPAE